ncbi:MAG: CerR family C-terminal domain-containing protein [Acidobacteria bacterium]|nr:CerR family C-terminal domain-containing protein [Acidobacteriota bacterium]
MESTTANLSIEQKTEEMGAKARILSVAEKLFAERGLAATSIRDLAREAGVNIAAVNYYFGSKENLYLETLRHTFQKTVVSSPKFDQLLKEAQIAKTPKAAQQAIREYIKVFLQLILTSDEARRHACLMSREINDPTPALDVIVEEFILPKHQALAALIVQAQPLLAESKDLPFYTISIVSQCLHYHFALPVALKLLNKKEMTPELINQIAKHIASFSLQALASLNEKNS